MFPALKRKLQNVCTITHIHMWEEGQQVIVAPLLLFHSPPFAFPWRFICLSFSPPSTFYVPRNRPPSSLHSSRYSRSSLNDSSPFCIRDWSAMPFLARSSPLQNPRFTVLCPSGAKSGFDAGRFKKSLCPAVGMVELS